MNVIVRADSSSKIGTGHIMRDLVLAKEFKNDNLIFVCQNLEGHINHKIKEANYSLELVTSNDISELISLIERLKIDMLVIDHYDIDEVYEKELKEKTGVKLFVVDDTYEKHYCDILLNHNIYADETKYKNLVPTHCELRCGSEYTLLREEFIEAKKNKQVQKKGEVTFFIAMGGSDILNLSPKILEVLSKFLNIKVIIVSTLANQNLEELKYFCEKKDWINLYINCNNVAELMANSDCAIITPSVTLNEVYFMELPFIAIQVADNQNDMYEFLERNNYSVMKKFEQKVLKEFIKESYEY